ncbi:serine/threonine-protein kinase [Calothrix sp. PCC 7507]|uniref:serine/threonine-protein kinase n=1 Tax=Calothrix sp. PCC 7507 TaxID=99598 RepID=UPI00029ED0A9|nr:serine/threonine-protein kinase [Calothrix sp. PCC 7507]AFY35307.1 serine/threonine protein kinase [Calothrix sp. PCC 7507]
MNRFSPKIMKLHESVSQQTQLGQMCGSKELFRDRYEVIRILGRGGFGITFLARNALLPGKPLCVIKQLCPKASSAKSLKKASERFEKEAKTLGQLGSHSQIPMLLDYFEGNGEFYLVQEYIRGSTLAREVRRTGRKNEAAVKQFLQELLPVLKYLHKHHVIHRDIKPQNLLRCEDDQRFVLIDFGAVKEKLAEVCENSNYKNMSTNFIGTMGFAPPEQFSLCPVYASDIYALGVTALYLLTGKGPLEFEHDRNTGEICWQKEVNVSDGFAQILSKMVKISLDERFKTADEVIRALGLESYVPTLTNCLTTQPLKNINNTQEEALPIYLPPVQRTAIAIRDWQAKLRAAKPHDKLNRYIHQVSN